MAVALLSIGQKVFLRINRLEYERGESHRYDMMSLS